MRRFIGWFVLTVFGLQAFLVSALWAENSVSKKPVAKSADQRFLDFGDGTILDTPDPSHVDETRLLADRKKVGELVYGQGICPAHEQ